MTEVAAVIETAEEEVIIEKTPEELEAETTTKAAKEAELVKAGAEEEEGELVVSIGEESPPQKESEPAPEWVKDLRKSKREDAKKIRELSERLESYEKKPDVELGAKPTLEGSGEDGYDTAIYEKDLTAWHEKKVQVDKKKAEDTATEESNNKAWQDTLGAYEVKKTALKAKVKDFDDAEALVKESLSVVYQGAILQGSKDPALLMLALGKNPQKLKELSSIKDPAKFIWAVATMESQLKVSNRKVATSPEKKIEGTASGAVDSTLAKLEAEAEKSGDRTKVLNYKRSKQ